MVIPKVVENNYNINSQTNNISIHKIKKKAQSLIKRDYKKQYHFTLVCITC